MLGLFRWNNKAQEKLLWNQTLTRIRLITEELYQPRELSFALLENAASNELVAFKAAVDELRQFLWHYLHEFLGTSQNAVGDWLRECQMRRAAQLLFALSAAHPYQIKPHPLEAAAQDAIKLAETTRASER